MKTIDPMVQARGAAGRDGSQAASLTRPTGTLPVVSLNSPEQQATSPLAETGWQQVIRGD
jgi:hypothetical protein